MGSAMQFSRQPDPKILIKLISKKNIITIKERVYFYQLSNGLLRFLECEISFPESVHEHTMFLLGEYCCFYLGP